MWERSAPTGIGSTRSRKWLERTFRFPTRSARRCGRTCNGAFILSSLKSPRLMPSWAASFPEFILTEPTYTLIGSIPMIRFIASIVAGYLVMAVLVVLGFSVAMVAPNFAFEQDRLDVTPGWILYSLVVSLVAAAAGGLVAA